MPALAKNSADGTAEQPTAEQPETTPEGRPKTPPGRRLGKAEAAALLGVSERTLERWVGNGRLTPQTEPGKTRPRVVFDARDVKTLRAQIAPDAPPPMPPAVPARTEGGRHVGFRLDAHYGSRLENEAAARGRSSGEFARELVIGALEQSALQTLAEEALATGRAVRRHRAEFADAMRMVMEMLILAVEGEAVTAEEARSDAAAWAREHLHGPLDDHENIPNNHENIPDGHEDTQE